MEFTTFADALTAASQTSKRLGKTKILSEFLQKISDKDLREIILLIQGCINPEYDDNNFGMSVQNVLRSLAKVSGNSLDSIKKQFYDEGDVGSVAANITGHKKQQTLFSESLSVQSVVSVFTEIKQQEGKNSTGTKIALLSGLLSQASGNEARIICNTLIGQLRVGIAAGVLRDSIAWSRFPELAKLQYPELFDIDEKSNEESKERLSEIIALIQRAIDVSSSPSEAAETLAFHGLDGLRRMKINLFRPFHVMLAQKTPSISEGVSSLELPVQAEYKYDGFRMQIHKSNDTVRLYTRRLEEVTEQFPDTLDAIRKAFSSENIIVDAEAVGILPDGKFAPFQLISQRIRRKYDIEKLAKEFPVQIRVFDIIVFDEKQLIDEPLSSRREMLTSALSENSIVKPSDCLVSDKEEDIASFYDEALASGNEGIMLKKLDAPYQPGSRVGTMLKCKPVMEHLDVVITKAHRGEGKRSSWFTSFTVACSDEDGDLVEIGKVSTGLKEDSEQGTSYADMTSLIEEQIIADHGKYVDVQPSIVMEVAYEEIQASNNYDAGFALRFPRFVLLRDDRGLEDISDVRYVAQLYNMQRGRGE